MVQDGHHFRWGMPHLFAKDISTLEAKFTEMVVFREMIVFSEEELQQTTKDYKSTIMKKFLE